MSTVKAQVEMTHKQAVKRVALWLRNNRRCSVVFAERNVTGVTEQPDAIGWYGAGGSILVECKVSRADFHADKLKAFRRYEDSGVGNTRYYAAPKGVLTPEDMPEGWGLLEIGEHNIREKHLPLQKEANKSAEVVMLVSAIRRLELSATVFVRHEEDRIVVEGAPDRAIELCV